MYEMCANLVVLAMLAYFTVTDLASHAIPWPVTVLAGALGVAGHLIGGRTLFACLLGALPGALLLLLSFTGKECIGKGDCFTLMACGALLGPLRVLSLLFLSLLFAGIWAVFLVVWKKKGRRTTFAFMPFMLVAQVCVMLG